MHLMWEYIQKDVWISFFSLFNSKKKLAWLLDLSQQRKYYLFNNLEQKKQRPWKHDKEIWMKCETISNYMMNRSTGGPIKFWNRKMTLLYLMSIWSNKTNSSTGNKRNVYSVFCNDIPAFHVHYRPSKIITWGKL